MALYHLDNDFLVYALAHTGPERRRLVELSQSPEVVQMSAIAWYEFARGPRTPEQLGVARAFLLADGVVPLTEEIAIVAADTYRMLGSPRRRAADIAIGITASLLDATLLTRNHRDFAGIAGLRLDVV